MRLQSARHASGLSTRGVELALAKRGRIVTHATIANFERGKAKPELSLVAVLAELYSRSINWFLLSGPTLSDVEYRSLKSVRQGDKRQFNARAHLWLEAYQSLERALGESLVNEFGEFSVDPEESGRSAAARIRRLLALSDEHPIQSVIQIAERFGIRVIDMHSNARIDALAGYLGDERVVVLNASLSNDRNRLNAAHELGHHIYQDCRGTKSLTSDEIEKRAFEFASHLLLPEPQLESAFQGASMIRLVEFKERFGASLASMIYRARRSSILNQRMYDRLWIEFAKRGWRKNEPGSVRPDRPRRFERLLESAIHTQRLTWVRAEKITGIRQNDLRSRVVAAAEAGT